MANATCQHTQAIRDVEAAVALGLDFDPAFDRLSEAICCSRRGHCNGELCQMSSRISMLTLRLVKYGRRPGVRACGCRPT